MHPVNRQIKQTAFNYRRRRNMSRKLKRVEMDCCMTTQEPVEQVETMEVMIMTVLTITPTTICPTSVEVPLQVQCNGIDK